MWKCLTTAQIRAGTNQIGLRFGKIRNRLIDFGGAAWSLQVAKLPSLLRQQLRGLVACGPVRRIVLRKQLRAGLDQIATLHENGGEEPFLGRADLHEVGVRIALPCNGFRRTAAPPPERAGSGGDQRERQNQAWDHGLYQSSLNFTHGNKAKQQGSSSFLKKRTKKLLFDSLPIRQQSKSFLFLFFKKEMLPYLPLRQRRTAIANQPKSK
jgi:hypothetical protein